MKKKLNLKKLRVDSFVTNIKEQNAEAVKGGKTKNCPETFFCPVLTGPCDPVSNQECTFGCPDSIDVFLCL